MIIIVFTLHSLKDFFVSIKVFVKVVLVSIMFGEKQKVFKSLRESICEREQVKMLKSVFIVTVVFVAVITKCYNAASSDAVSVSYTVSDNNKTNSSCVLPHSWNWLLERDIVLPNRSDVKCSPIARPRCYCLTMDNRTLNSSLSFGHCLYGCFVTDRASEYRKVSILENNSFINESCSLFNRKGILCGQCIKDHGPAVYSFSLMCVPCSNLSLWITIPYYILVAYGPLTIFLGVIVVFTISVNTALLRGFILSCQLLSCSIFMRIMVASEQLAIVPHSYSFAFTHIFGSVYGIWNLDFFRSMYKPFCLHPSLTTFQVMSLDYIIAAYPLVIILLMYALVDLHSRNYRPLVYVGRLFHCCCVRFRHRLNIRTSLVDAFGNFFSLSFIKFLSTSADILVVTKVWNTNNNKTHYRAYFDGTNELFKGHHIPYALLAVTVTIIFNLLPTVLILIYAFPRGNVIIKHFPVFLQKLLYPFMDNILACYADGTNGTRNRRYFGVVYHIALFIFINSYVWAESIFLLGVIVFICILAGMLVALIQPYKRKLYNTVDVILLLSTGLCSVAVLCSMIAYIEAPINEVFILMIAIVPFAIPLIYLLGTLAYKLFERIPCQQIITRFQRHTARPNTVVEELNIASETSLLIQ